MRRTADEIQAKRQKRESTILVTGATGFLGSHLATGLLGRGHRLILLARPQQDRSAEQRMAKLMEWFGLGTELNSGRIRVIEAHLEKPRLGLDDSVYAGLLRSVDEIFHCAADTSFAERKRSRVEESNITATHNVLDLAVQGKCAFFHHISTAYVAGRRQGICTERLEETHDFNNVYEETKHASEFLVDEMCSAEGIRRHIYRPSIVYGDSQSGRSFRFNALYYPIRLAHYFRDLYLKDIRENGGKNASDMGVSLRADGKLFLPLRIEEHHAGSLNVIPIDFFTRAVMALMDHSANGDLFHIVNRNNVRLDLIIKYIKRYFAIEGIRPVPRESFLTDAKNPLEKLLSKHLEVYEPYMKDLRVFDQQHSKNVLDEAGILCPKFDYSMFERCVGYALETDWGKRL